MAALSQIRAALRQEALQGASSPPSGPPMPSSPQRPLPGPPGGLSVGPWLPPGTAPGFWGALTPASGHPGEADALVSRPVPAGAQGGPVALLRRRWHQASPADPEAALLAPVALFELLAPGGSTLLSALTAEALLDELAFRLQAAG